jgi:hypothetical protein
MTPEQFCYWLQGFIELSGNGIALSKAQMDMVREHLALVFNKVTPPLAVPQPTIVPQIIPLPYIEPVRPSTSPWPWSDPLVTYC